MAEVLINSHDPEGVKIEIEKGKVVLQNQKNVLIITANEAKKLRFSNCEQVVVHAFDPEEITLSSSKQTEIHVYSDKYNSSTPIEQDLMDNTDSKIVYHAREEYFMDDDVNCKILKNGKEILKVKSGKSSVNIKSGSVSNGGRIVVGDNNN